jgi:cellulose biosynthesis protein BcsQ
MTREPKFISITSQKGGIGKSTLTSVVCSLLHYKYGYNVAVIDCDEYQGSIYKMRERDREINTSTPEKIEALKDYFGKLGKRAYPVERSSLANAVTRAETLIRKRELEYDLVFFDFPGSVGPANLLPTVAALDHLFCPITADIFTLESTLSFSRLLLDHVISSGDQRLKSIHLFWNMVDSRESTYLYDVYDDYLEKEGIPLMKVFLPKQVRFTREQSFNNSAFFRSSFFIPDKSYLAGSNIEPFIAEMLQIIQK